MPKYSYAINDLKSIFCHLGLITYVLEKIENNSIHYDQKYFQKLIKTVFLVLNPIPHGGVVKKAEMKIAPKRMYVFI